MKNEVCPVEPSKKHAWKTLVSLEESLKKPLKLGKTLQCIHCGDVYFEPFDPLDD